MNGEQRNIHPEAYDLGIKDYLIGGGLWVVHLLTRQMNHPPVQNTVEQPVEAPEAM